MPQIQPDPELKGIESALGELIPLFSRLDRDKLMFQAGAMSRPAPYRPWAWPAIAVALSVALAGESFFLASRPAPRAVERIVYLPANTDATGDAAQREEPRRPGIEERQPAGSGPFAARSSGAAADYQRLQNLVMRFGLDALPERTSVAFRPEGGGFNPGSDLLPAGALRNLELERILKHGGPL